MGTNFYLVDKTRLHFPEPLHIGLSSGGWCFHLHIDPRKSINDLSDWVNLFRKPGFAICNDYKERIQPGDMQRAIEGRVNMFRNWEDGWWWRGDGRYHSEAHFHELNRSERGPLGLLRHRLGVEGGLCVKHGAGTWDCLVGEFS